ncbi:MAG: RES family NAD+ phosphorylase [Cyclobacteriaceae bacterium]|nr:RES family NAD+ phosphorylase [Cyclobacteriaceae bacterium HetDA_MAG_MS6]
MQVFRLTHPKYAQDISGYGSLMVPGRWNFKGHRVLYTAENSSLALLEYLVHTEGLARRLPYQLVTIEIPDTIAEEISVQDLGPGWKEDVVKIRRLGSEWLQSESSLVLKVPSVINDDNSNFLINPEHADFAEVRIVASKVITFDRRLW